MKYEQRKTGRKIRSGQRRVAPRARKNFAKDAASWKGCRFGTQTRHDCPSGGTRWPLSMGRRPATSWARPLGRPKSLILRAKIYARKKTPPRGEFERTAPVRTHQKIREKIRPLRQTRQGSRGPHGNEKAREEKARGEKEEVSHKRIVNCRHFQERAAAGVNWPGPFNPYFDWE